MVNELSVSSFGNIKGYVEKRINSKEKNNEKFNRELFEINDDLFEEEINKNHIEYEKPDITNNEINKIIDKKLKMDDYNQNINLVSEKQSILKENEKYNKVNLNKIIDDFLLKKSKSFYLGLNIKAIIFLICLTLNF